MSTFLGLYEQRTELAAGATPALVEGAFDVLALAAPDPGHRLVPVSPCGTHLSPRQLAELLAAATSRTMVIAFDNEAAGRAAATRIQELATVTGIRVSTMALADGLDPASVKAAGHDSILVAAKRPLTETMSGRVYRDRGAAPAPTRVPHGA